MSMNGSRFLALVLIVDTVVAVWPFKGFYHTYKRAKKLGHI